MQRDQKGPDFPGLFHATGCLLRRINAPKEMANAAIAIAVTVRIKGYLPLNPSLDVCFIRIPVYAQIKVSRYTASRRRNAQERAINTPTARTIAVHVISLMPQPDQPMETRKVVTFAMVATVIQPRYTEKGTERAQ